MPTRDAKDLNYVYQMSIVERMTGLSRRRIRYYEKAGLISPQRTSGGHRLYSPHNVETLRRIKALIDSGITTMESVRRMIEGGLDVVPQQESSPRNASHGGPRWRQRDLGDAAVRVMRPVEPRVGAAGRPGESDSRAFFGRTSIIPRPGKDERRS